MRRGGGGEEEERRRRGGGKEECSRARGHEGRRMNEHVGEGGGCGGMGRAALSPSSSFEGCSLSLLSGVACSLDA